MGGILHSSLSWDFARFDVLVSSTLQNPLLLLLLSEIRKGASRDVLVDWDRLNKYRIGE